MASPSTFYLDSFLSQTLRAQSASALLAQSSVCPSIPCKWQKASAARLKDKAEFTQGGSKGAF